MTITTTGIYRHTFSGDNGCRFEYSPSPAPYFAGVKGAENEELPEEGEETEPTIIEEEEPVEEEESEPNKEVEEG